MEVSDTGKTRPSHYREIKNSAQRTIIYIYIFKIMGVGAYLFGEGYPSPILSTGMNMTSSTSDNIDVILIRMRSIKLKWKVPHVNRRKMLLPGRMKLPRISWRLLLFCRLDYIYFLNYSHWIMKGMKEISNSLTFALLGGGVGHPVRFFANGKKTAALRAAGFSLPTFTYRSGIIMQEHFHFNTGFNFLFNTILLKLLMVLEIVSKYHFAHLTVFLPIGICVSPEPSFTNNFFAPTSLSPTLLYFVHQKVRAKFDFVKELRYSDETDFHVDDKINSTKFGHWLHGKPDVVAEAPLYSIKITRVIITE